MNLHEALTKGAFILEQKKVESPQLSCEMILAKATKQPRSAVLGAADRALTAEEEATFKNCLARRAAGEPMAYLTESIEFYSHEFGIQKGVFIPRPESELLVEKALDFLAENDDPKIGELCTGCGCIIISLIMELGDGEFFATDISNNAIKVAEYNARKHDVSKLIEFREGNMFHPYREALANNFDLLIINPPYIKSTDIAKLPSQIKDYEPHAALDGGRDGLNFYRTIIDSGAQFLAPKGAILFELDPTLVAPIRGLLQRRSNTFEEPEVFQDLAGLERAMLLRPKAKGGFGL